MNQIKFRALNKETKVFVYGDLIKSEMFGSEGSVPSSSLINESPLDVEDIITGLGGGRYSFKTAFVKVIDETVGQFTGIQDKNGVDIYAGDIVKFRSRYDSTVGCVEYSEETTRFVFNIGSQEKPDYRDVGHGWYGTEIIGNIHQNPELKK